MRLGRFLPIVLLGIAVLLWVPAPVQAQGCACSGQCKWTGAVIECAFCLYCCTSCYSVAWWDCYDIPCYSAFEASPDPTEAALCTGGRLDRDTSRGSLDMGTSPASQHRRFKILRVSLTPARS